MSSYGAIRQAEAFDVEASAAPAEGQQQQQQPSVVRSRLLSVAAFLVAIATVAVLVSTSTSFPAFKGIKTMKLSEEDYAWTGFIPSGGENTPPPSPAKVREPTSDTHKPTHKPTHKVSVSQ